MFSNSDGDLSLIGLYRGHSNAKRVSFSIALREQKWHSLVSLEIGILIHRLMSMVSLWFKMW